MVFLSVVVLVTFIGSEPFTRAVANIFPNVDGDESLDDFKGLSDLNSAENDNQKSSQDEEASNQEQFEPFGDGSGGGDEEVDDINDDINDGFTANFNDDENVDRDEDEDVNTFSQDLSPDFNDGSFLLFQDNINNIISKTRFFLTFQFL